MEVVESQNGLRWKGSSGSSSSSLEPEHLPVVQAARSSIQPGLECIQALGIYSFSGQLVQGLTLIVTKKKTSSFYQVQFEPL